MSGVTVSEAVDQRQSVRAYCPKPVSEALILGLLSLCARRRAAMSDVLIGMFFSMS